MMTENSDWFESLQEDPKIENTTTNIERTDKDTQKQNNFCNTCKTSGKHTENNTCCHERDFAISCENKQGNIGPDLVDHCEIQMEQNNYHQSESNTNHKNGCNTILDSCETSKDAFKVTQCSSHLLLKANITTHAESKSNLQNDHSESCGKEFVSTLNKTILDHADTEEHIEFACTCQVETKPSNEIMEVDTCMSETVQNVEGAERSCPNVSQDNSIPLTFTKFENKSYSDNLAISEATDLLDMQSMTQIERLPMEVDKESSSNECQSNMVNGKTEFTAAKQKFYENIRSSTLQCEEPEIIKSNKNHEHDKPDQNIKEFCDDQEDLVKEKVKIDDVKKSEGQIDVYDIDAEDEAETSYNPQFRKLKQKSCDSNSVTEKHEKTALQLKQPLLKCGKPKNGVSEKTEQKPKQKVVYVYTKELVKITDQMQKIPERASMVHSLIEAYGLTKYMRIVEPRRATEEEVLLFHDTDYINFLKKLNLLDDIEKFEEEAIQFGLSYDCPIHEGLYQYATITTGATLAAVDNLLQGTCKVAINWCGGWHHAAKDHASGFCYINDIVLGILKLKQKYNRILYVDLDLHHGDGVEDAFAATPTVLTMSVHKYSPGFFPGTGGVDNVGIGKGEYYTVNIPLLDGITDAEFTPFICRVLNKIKERYSPEVVVCQCGADGLAGDPMESFNLTHRGLGKCLYFILQWDLPTLILGGGGYNLTNTARCWTFLTSLAVGKQLPTDLPDHRYFMEYGPDYDLEVHAGNRKNHNTPPYIRQVYSTVMNNINKIPQLP